MRISVGPSLFLEKEIKDGPVGQTSQTPLFRQPNGWKWKSARAQACLEATIRQNDLMRGCSMVARRFERNATSWQVNKVIPICLRKGDNKPRFSLHETPVASVRFIATRIAICGQDRWCWKVLKGRHVPSPESCVEKISCDVWA